MKKYNLTKEQIEDVFLCGFYSSEEGFNGEYPFMLTDDSVWNHKFNYNEEKIKDYFNRKINEYIPDYEK